MTIFYTSDTHFGHKNIIRYSERPFKDVEEMNRQLILRWNETVSQDDTVYHLGDFAFRNKDAASKTLEQLNGKIHFIWGNHDSEEVKHLKGWASSQPYAEIYDGGKKVVLCHYSMRVWNKSHYGALMLYGHSHGSLPGNSQSLDVGTDCWDYRPVTLVDIQRRMATLPTHFPVDHHK